MDGIVEPPVAGYTGWWDASDLASLTLDGGRVTTWNDKSGGGFHATGAAGLKPVLVRPVGLFNNRPVLAFGGGTQTGSTQMTSGFGVSDMTASFFIAALVLNLSQAGTLVGPNNDGGWSIRANVTTGLIESSKSDNATLGTLSTPATVPGVPFVVGGVLAATSITHYLNAAAGETDAHAQTLTAARTLVIGSAPTLASPNQLSGFIAEIVAFGTSLSSGDAALMQAYLMNKWAIS